AACTAWTDATRVAERNCAGFSLRSVPGTVHRGLTHAAAYTWLRKSGELNAALTAATRSACVAMLNQSFAGAVGMLPGEEGLLTDPPPVMGLDTVDADRARRSIFARSHAPGHAVFFQSEWRRNGMSPYTERKFRTSSATVA